MRYALILFALLGLGACFEPDEPLCAFQCGDNNLCPDDYLCLPDGYCHLRGQAGDCKFPDGSVVIPDGGDDMSVATDMSEMDLTQSSTD